MAWYNSSRDFAKGAKRAGAAILTGGLSEVKRGLEHATEMPSIIYPETEAPSAGDRTIQEAINNEIARRKRALGRSSMIKTGPASTLGDAPVQRKTLLGF